MKIPNIEERIRAMDTAQKRELEQILNWSESQTSRFIGGNQGINIHLIDRLIRFTGLVLVSKTYLNAISECAKVGVHCQCARDGGGECQAPN